jgi:hypothetical protein
VTVGRKVVGVAKNRIGKMVAERRARGTCQAQPKRRGRICGRTKKVGQDTCGRLDCEEWVLVMDGYL